MRLNLFALILLLLHTTLIKAQVEQHFTKNLGQIIDEYGQECPQVRYQLRQKQNRSIYFMNRGLAYVLESPLWAGQERSQVRIDMTFLDANANPTLIEHERANSTSNYHRYTGSETKSIMNIPSFKELHYKDIYSGIDLHFYQKKDGLKYDFIIAPSAKKTPIRWKYTGANYLRINEKGALDIYTKYGRINESIPKVYFLENPDLPAPAVHYVLEDKATVRLEVERYDQDLTLVIDPLATWATYFGGVSNDYAHGLVLDGNHLYMAGETQSSNFPSTPGVTQTTAGGSRDAFISKFTKTGNPVWTTYYGGTGSDVAEDVAIRNGELYIAGHTTGNLPVTAGAHQTTYAANTDAFLAKFDTNGLLQWGTYYGGGELDEAYDVAIDNAGNVVITGATETSQFPVGQIIATTGAFQYSKGGNEDVFIAKFTSSGTRLWGTYVGGNDTERGYNIATDSNNDIIITGETYGGSSFSEFPTGAAGGYTAYQTTQGGGFGDKDAFVFKINPSGTSRLFSTYYGGSTIERGYGIAVDPSDNIIITGNTNGNDLPTTFGTIQPFWGGGGSWGNSDAFIVKFNALGERQWATYYGGNNSDQGFSVHAPDNDKIIIIGETSSTNLPSLTACPSCTGTFCGFVAQVSSNGSTLEFASYLGGAGTFNSGQDVQGDAASNLYVTGYTTSTNYPVGGNTYQATNAGNADAFFGLVNSIDCEVLPLELMSFQATPEQEDVLLEWYTSSETETFHFELQQSIDGQIFEQIAQLAAAGNSTTLRRYQHLAESPWQSGQLKLYFRLKMVDVDGKFTYSEIATVGREGFIHLSVFPNPTRGELFLELDVPEAQNVVFTLLDIHGRVVRVIRKEQLLSLRSSLSLEGLGTGAYVLRVDVGQRVFYRRVVRL